jgi:excisionase family DNA binding protein
LTKTQQKRFNTYKIIKNRLFHSDKIFIITTKHNKTGQNGMKLLTAKEAAKRLGIGSYLLNKMVDQGMIKRIEIPGGHPKYPEAEIDRLAQQTERKRDAVN